MTKDVLLLATRRVAQFKHLSEAERFFEILRGESHSCVLLHPRGGIPSEIHAFGEESWKCLKSSVEDYYAS